MSHRPIDDETLSNLFARAYQETGSLADAFWSVSAIVTRGSTHDVAAAGLHEVVAQVAVRHDLTPQEFLGASRHHTVAVARFECWWLLRQRGVSFGAIGSAFGRDKSTVISGVRRFAGMLEQSAELRATVAWEASLRRSAA